MRLKIDLHVHTTGSGDSFVEPEQLPVILKKRGLDGVAITDHDLVTKVASLETIILPGIEISTRQGHIIGLGISDPIAKGKTADVTIALIHAAGGVAIIPHPFDPPSPCVNPFKLSSRPEAIETINSDALFFYFNTRLAKRAANDIGLPMVAGSDSHIPETIGDAYTLIDSKSRRIDDILNAIRTGAVQPVGRPTSLSKKFVKLRRRLGSL